MSGGGLSLRVPVDVCLECCTPMNTSIIWGPRPYFQIHLCGLVFSRTQLQMSGPKIEEPGRFHKWLKKNIGQYTLNHNKFLDLFVYIYIYYSSLENAQSIRSGIHLGKVKWQFERWTFVVSSVRAMLPRDPFYRKPIDILSFHPDPGAAKKGVHLWTIPMFNR